MSKSNLYVQVMLTKGNQIDVSWVPEQFAVKDRTVKLKLNGEWDEGWKVEDAYLICKKTEEQVISSRDAHKHHRKNTDA